jgi:hypothetical protein
LKVLCPEIDLLLLYSQPHIASGNMSSNMGNQESRAARSADASTATSPPRVQRFGINYHAELPRQDREYWPDDIASFWKRLLSSVLLIENPDDA